MPVTVKCQCGNTYELKDVYGGRSVKCPKCATVNVAPAAPPKAEDPAFARDVFLLRQKAMAIKSKYYVWDERGNTILYVERPTYVFRGLIALFAGLAAALAVVFVLGFASSAAGEGAISDILIVLAGVGAVTAFLGVGIALSPKRHVTFYRDDTMGERLLEVIQDHKLQIIIATYTIRDPKERVLATLRKNYLYNIFRKRWQCFAPNGTVLCVAMEDSIILSLLRRVLGPFFGLLRTNYVILSGTSDSIAGEFNRKMTLLDRYVLDMKQDPRRQLDRRIMLALGVMLDTGERR